MDVEGKGDGEGSDLSNQKGHHQEGGRPQDVKNSGSGVMNEVGTREGLKKGLRDQKVTKLVGTKRGSEGGTRRSEGDKIGGYQERV